MKLHHLVSGIAAGYASKGLQLVASLLLVPFFLREDMLGLDGFGRVFTISALIGLLPLITGGVAFSFIRSVSRSLDGADGDLQTREVMGAGLKVLGAGCGVAVLATLAASPIVLPTVGLEESPEVLLALALCGLLYWIENILNLLRAPLLARGAITFVNATSAAEVLLRALAYLVVFSQWSATLVGYFAIQAVFAALRGVVQLAFLNARWPEDLRGAWRVPWTAGRASIRDSWSIATQIGTMTLVHRLPVLLANGLIGPEASGLAAIALITVRGYVLQSLFAVVQPIAVPLASRVDPRQLSEHRRVLLSRVEGLYVIFSGILVATGVVCMPEFITLWLGADYQVVVVASQAMLIACGVEVAFNGRLSLLIGQHLLHHAIPGLLIATCLSGAASVVALVFFGSWQLAVLSVCLYFPVSTLLGVDPAYRRELLGKQADAGPRPHLLALLLLGGAIAWAFSQPEAGRGLLFMLGRVVVNGVAFALLAHWLVLPLGGAIETLRTLWQARDRRLVGGA